MRLTEWTDPEACGAAEVHAGLASPFRSGLRERTSEVGSRDRERDGNVFGLMSDGVAR